MELILSSGFLAFARHCGVIDAVQKTGIQIDGLCGTSSGALVGAMWLAGHHPDFIQETLLELPPYRMLSLSSTPWKGLLSMQKLQAKLNTLLPQSFTELGRPFGVGVCHKTDGHCLLREGDLPAAVAASCAMPYVFSPVKVGEAYFFDGGTLDRLGAEAWRAKRTGNVIIHAVNRTAGASKERGVEGAVLIRTPRSGASFFSLGPFTEQRKEACKIALEALNV